MWEEIEFDAEKIPLFKLIAHGAQILIVFILWCLEITVFRADGAAVNGNNGWTFAACFLTIPAWVYLIMTPRFPRTRRFAQPQVMVALDALFTVIWLSAFATQAAYNTANSCGSACGISKAIVALGFFVFLLFCVTTFLSIYTLKYYTWNNRLPGYDSFQSHGGQQNIDPDKAAFSMAPHDEEAYAPVHVADHDHDHDDDHDDHGYGANPFTDASNSSQVNDPYATVHSTHSQSSHNPFDSEVDYHGGSQYGSSVGGYAPPTAHDDYDEHSPAQFPAANYDRTMR